MVFFHSFVPNFLVEDGLHLYFFLVSCKNIVVRLHIYNAIIEMYWGNFSCYTEFILPANYSLKCRTAVLCSACIYSSSFFIPLHVMKWANYRGSTSCALQKNLDFKLPK